MHNWYILFSHVQVVSLTAYFEIMFAKNPGTSQTSNYFQTELPRVLVDDRIIVY